MFCLVSVVETLVMILLAVINSFEVGFHPDP